MRFSVPLIVAIMSVVKKGDKLGVDSEGDLYRQPSTAFVAGLDQVLSRVVQGQSRKIVYQICTYLENHMLLAASHHDALVFGFRNLQYTYRDDRELYERVETFISRMRGVVVKIMEDRSKDTAAASEGAGASGEDS